MFKIGDLLIDAHTGEAGILLRRYDLLHEDLTLGYDGKFHHWAWQIWWTGGVPQTYYTNLEDYTETGLKQLVESGLFILHKR